MGLTDAMRKAVERFLKSGDDLRTVPGEAGVFVRNLWAAFIEAEGERATLEYQNHPSWQSRAEEAEFRLRELKEENIRLRTDIEKRTPPPGWRLAFLPPDTGDMLAGR